MKDQSAVPVQPKLSIFNDQVWASSVDVANHFEKRHNDVLRSIRNMEVPDEFGLRNFAQSSYFNEQNKEQPAFDMTRDGFTLLAMGFTGPKAMAFKIAYLEAFNKMEEQLKGRGGAVTEQRYMELMERHMELMERHIKLVDEQRDQEVKRLEEDLQLADQGKRRYMTQNQRNQIVHLRNKGWTTSMIAKHLGFTRQAITSCEKRMRIKEKAAKAQEVAQ